MFNNIYSEQAERSDDPFFSALIKAGITPHDQRNTVYKYVTIATAKAILENCTLKFSSPLIFNDPFEMNPGFLDLEVSRAELINRMEQILNSKNQRLTPNKLQDLKSKPLKELMEPYRWGFEIKRHRTLLLCTSRTYESTLMWSHYADNHTGVCIGFVMPTIYAPLDMFTCNVHYTSAITPLKVLSGTDNERSIALYTWINTKSKVWEYEQEVRTCIPNINEMNLPENLYEYVPIDPKQICEVYFGAGTKLDDIDDIKRIIRDRKYQIEKAGKMSISSSTFDLVCNLLTDI